MRQIVWVLMMLCIGCANYPVHDVHRSSEQDTLSSVSQLAGTWEYEEGGMTYQIELDSMGHGTYDWQEGSFNTLSLSHGTWRGTWHQKGNDREGEFEARLSNNAQMAEGRWWYTRIGNDREPNKPGGAFTLTRQPVVACRKGRC